MSGPDRSSSPPLTVYSSPLVRGNPYQRLLGAALIEAGSRTAAGPRPRLRQVLGRRGRSTLLHLHWPEIIIGSNRQGPFADLRSILKAARLMVVLSAARLRGIRIVWTIHNLEPHEARRPSIDRAVNGRIAKMSSCVLAHSRHAARRAEDLYPAAEISVAYHGNYVAYYPEPRRGRAEVRRALGVPDDARVLLAFGFIRPYKRLPDLLSAFREIERRDCRLVVAGFPFRPALRDELEGLAAQDDRVILMLERIDDAEVEELHRAVDVCVLAYRDVFSSGALLLALSLGVPVVAPADSTATELAPPPAVIPFREGHLRAALEEGLELGPAAGERALQEALRYDWTEMASIVLGRPASG